MNSKLTSELCDDFRIPYFFHRMTIHYKTKEKVFEGLPKGYMEMSYLQAMDHNDSITNDTMKTHINIILKNCEDADRIMVVDLDDKKDQEIFHATFGNNFKTKSSRKGLPHLWFIKKENDYSKNAQKIKINGTHTNIDLCYNNILENADSRIEYSGDITSMPVFDFEQYHPDPIDEPPVARQPVTPSQEYNGILKLYFCKRVVQQLDNIDPVEYVNKYSHWFKIGNGIKHVFSPLDGDTWFEVLVKWSENSTDPKHKYDDTEKWRKLFEQEPKCGLATIMEYSRKSNEKRFNEIEKEYREAKKVDDDAERRIVLDEGRELLMKTIREYDAEQEKKNAEFPFYEMVKEEFEKKYCLIKEASCYLEECGDYFKFYEPSAFNVSHKMIKYFDYDKNGVLKEEKFLKRWTEDSDIRQYQKCDMFPPPLKCPDNVFNMWRPFYVQTLKGEYEKNERALEMFLKHMKILCNHQQDATDYLIMWIGQMFKYPAEKTILPTMIAEEGAGRGTLIELLRKMMGEEKVFETSNPSRDVWGSFNSLMMSAFFVNLNEMSLKETLGAEGVIKTLITDNALTINQKGINAFKTKSHHRFMVSTNNEDPLKTKKGDRRNFIVYSSNELCRENNPKVVEEYFIPLRDIMFSESGIRTIYDYVINLEGLDKFFSMGIPKTEYQNDMKEANRSYYELWLEDYVSKNPKTDELGVVELNSAEMITSFTSYLQVNRINFETNAIKLGLQVTRMKARMPNGCIEKKHLGRGNVITFDVGKLQKYFQIGCLIDLNNL